MIKTECSSYFLTSNQFTSQEFRRITEPNWFCAKHT
jgi:hypothetical protein